MSTTTRTTADGSHTVVTTNWGDLDTHLYLNDGFRAVAATVHLDPWTVAVSAAVAEDGLAESALVQGF